MFSNVLRKICTKSLNVYLCLLFSFFLPFSYLSANQTDSFSAIDGITAFQNRAPGNSTLSSIYAKWKRAIQFYVGSGISRLPNSLVADLRSAGITVETNLSQQEIDQKLTISSSDTGVIEQDENTNSTTSNAQNSSTDPVTAVQNSTIGAPDNSASTNASSLASGAAGADVGQTATNLTDVNPSNSSVGGSAGTSSAASNTPIQTPVEESNLLGSNGRTSYLVSTQFGRIIQALGGNSAGNINRAAARGFTNLNGIRPPSLHSDLPVNNGGSNISPSGDTNGSSPDISGSVIEDTITGLADQISGGGGSGSFGGSLGSNTEGSSGGTFGDSGDISGGGNVTGGYDASANFTCSSGADGGQCVKYVRDQFADHPGVSGLSPLCGTSSDPDEDCGAKFAYLNDLWDLGFGKGVTPRKNSVAVWYSQNSDYGHMAVVSYVSQNPDGTYSIVINDSNWTGNETQMCAIPYVVNTSTMQTFRNGNPNPKTLIGFIYGEPVDSNSGGDGSTTGGSLTTGSTDNSIVAIGSSEVNNPGTNGTGTSNSSGATSGDQSNTSGEITASPVTLGLSVSSIVFNEYGTSQSSLTNSQVIGTDISETDFLQANEQTNPALVSFYNGIKNDSDFKSIAESALAINPEKAAPKLILADDNQVNGGSGITPQYNPNTNEIILSNAFFSQNTLTEMKIIGIHELAHSQQQVRVFDSEQLYGPDGQHYVTEITSLTGAYVEGYAEFWQAYYDPNEWAKFQFGMAHCGFRREGSSSTAQNPEYNGISGASLNCEDMIPWTSLEKEDFFKIEGLIASILLEVSLRLPDGFSKVLQALALENNADTNSLDLLNMLGQILSGEDNVRYLLILDVMTNFRYSLEELKQISGASSLTIEGLAYDQPMALFEGLTGRELFMQESRKTIDSNGFAVDYNGFHALDGLNTSFGSQALLPRIDSRALSRGSNKASEPDSNGEIFFSGTKETAFTDIDEQQIMDQSTQTVHNGY